MLNCRKWRKEAVFFCQFALVLNITAPDISRKTGHTGETYDRHIKTFKKVKTLHGSMSFPQIARTLEMSKFLVKEHYLNINTVCYSSFNSSQVKTNQSKTGKAILPIA